MATPSQTPFEPPVETPPLSSKRVTRNEYFAGIGLIVPYVVGVVSILALGSHVGDYDFYESGALATYDTVTAILTLTSFVLGLCLCVPAFAPLVRDQTTVTKTLRFLALMTAVVFHLACVAALRFVTYVAMGGIL